ncbi:MAG: bla regulator protein blaR1 [Acidobacteriaceae bacterium]|nr:bla regulator protein blaR1 [Acidobacteriaceae bacterium]
MMAHQLAAVANHLWQSTVFALGAATLAVILRGVPARIRYWLWLAASLKFLIPFSLLLFLGGSLVPAQVTISRLQPATYYSLDVVSQPFTFTPVLSGPARSTLLSGWPLSTHILFVVGAVWVAGIFMVVGSWIFRWWSIVTALRTARPAMECFEASVLRKLEERAQVRRPIPLFISDTSWEPGIFGIVSPVLVWPQGISKRLSEAQIEAILAHELAHARYLDNLTAILHLLVQAIFWFHPIVWWLQSRLMQERERACDETVVILGSEPEIYAAAILRACEFSIESPVAYFSGITGSDLKRRVRRIVLDNPVRRLTRSRKLLLAGLAAAAVLGPIVFGFVDAPRVRASLVQGMGANTAFGFEVATIKPGDAGSRRSMMMSLGRFATHDMPLRDVIMFAYDAKSTSQISGYPDWVSSAVYDIDAKEDETTTAALEKLPMDERIRQVRLMVQALLAERFQLKVSHHMTEIPVYALVIAKGGPKLKPSTTAPMGNETPHAGETPRGGGIFNAGPGELHSNGATLDFFASGPLSRVPETDGRVVINKTGLTGNYDFTLKWAPDGSGPAGSAPVSDNSGPGLFTALEEQLGLKLVSQKGSVETLVVESVDRPSAN